MLAWIRLCGMAWAAMLLLAVNAVAQQPPGSLRGSVYDKDFDAPLAAAQVLIVETGQRTATSEQGHYVFSEVAPGRYTLVVTKEGFVRQVKAGVVVSPGELTDLDVFMPSEFTEMEEFLVQDLQLGAGTEAALLKLRFESAALMDSISSDLMSRAGAGDAASALPLVSGASVQEGKFAVIRGLPDRYVSSQMNGVRLPTADEDKRAVELDQFPAAVIESIRVSKTFTPDQQGDASGGAVDVRLKGIPDENILQLNTQLSANSQVYGSDDFLTSKGGGVDTWGEADGKDMQLQNLGSSWDGAVGVTRDDAPTDYKWSAAGGGTIASGNGVRLGGLASFFYERDSSYYDNGRNDSLWVTHPGDPLTPQTSQGTPTDGDFKTALFDVTQGSQSVQWGGLGTLGLEGPEHAIDLTYLFTRTAEDKATLAEDTRGKAFFFPGYDPNDPTGPGNTPGTVNSAPYIRTETLEYTERTSDTLQLHGRHKLLSSLFGDGGLLRTPELDWILAKSSANLDQPDKRQFGALWQAPSFHPGFPPFLPPFTTPATWSPFKPGANYNLGNLQRIWMDIQEDSDQSAVNLKLPFEQWSGNEGYLKVGVFDDDVKRHFNQDTFSNFGDAGASFEGGFNDFWSAVFPFEDHPITASPFDVDYDGEQKISAKYGMLDLPLSSSLTLVGGARAESTEIGIVNHPEPDALWIKPGESAPTTLDPGEADVAFQQDDVLPSIGIEYRPNEQWTLRAARSETVARQTFKELTPIVQQEFAGGPVFIGNPDLQMSGLKNADLRADYVPYDGGLVSASWFHKDVENPIEYVQTPGDYTFTSPVNYPKGELTGYEIELRQDLGQWKSSLDGISIGANATFIDSEVTLPADEAAAFAATGIEVPITKRDMTAAPEHLYNLYLTWDLDRTKLALFYTVTGDTLVAGAGQSDGNFVPDVYAKEYGTLNFSLSHRLSERATLQFQAKNLTNPRIEEVYRSDTTGEVLRSSSSRGREFSLGLNIRF